VHPAVPPGGALLRTSVMATHDRDTLERALSAFAAVKSAFEAEHGPLPGPGDAPPSAAEHGRSGVADAEAGDDVAPVSNTATLG